MTTSLVYRIESVAGSTFIEVPELLPFETRMYEVHKVAGYAPADPYPYLLDKCHTKVDDHGTFYKVSVTNTTNERQENCTAVIPSTSLNLSSTTESLQILPVHRSETSNVPYADLFHDCVAYWDFMGEWSRKNHAAGLITAAEKRLRDFDNKVAAFYGTLRQAAFDEFEAERAAAKNELAGQWQAKEDYAKATGDWELINYGNTA